MCLRLPAGFTLPARTALLQNGMREQRLSRLRRVGAKLSPPLNFRSKPRVSRHVHIITLSERQLPRNYVLSLLAESWRAQGISVTVGPIGRLEADVGILHVDATTVPAGCLPANPLGRPILNAGALDISKRRISGNLLARNSDHAGPVIVKTNANCFGTRESKQLSRFSPKRLRKRLAKILPWQWVRELPRGTYPILDSLPEVPDWVWQREDLVVERFLPEIENGEFVLRSWLFLGDQDYVVKVYCPEPIVKAGRASHHEPLDSVPQSLRARRAQLGMDYGKFDYVMIGGEAVLLDANTTPASSADGSPSSRLMHVAAGILPYADASK